MTMKRKAQSAMEYLMTYGWAILIVFIVLVALYALGVFNPTTWRGMRSTGFANLGHPTEWLYDTNGNFNITLRNSMGDRITINKVTANCGPEGSSVVLSTTGSTTIGAGGTIEYYNDTCDHMSTGSGYSLSISLVYRKFTGVISRTDSGTVTGTVI